MASTGLTPKQERFVQEYLHDLNATAAYKRAGYQSRSDNVAAAASSALLRNRKVAAAVEAAQAERARRTELTNDEVIDGLRAEVKFHGYGAQPAARVAALKLLGQHLGMFPREVKHSGSVGIDVGRDLARRALVGDREASLVDRILDELAGGGDQSTGAGAVPQPGEVPPGPPPPPAQPQAPRLGGPPA